MEKIDFLERLKQLVNQEDIISINHQVNDLKTQFLDFMMEEDRKLQVDVMEQEVEEEALKQMDPVKEEFFEIYQAFKEKKRALVSAIKIEEEANLRKKQALMSKLKNLIQEEENIGVAVNTYKEIHEEWKTIGDIPSAKRQEIQQEYSRLLESFFFNLKIYRELKDHDYKRNAQLKRELTEKVLDLLKLKQIKDVEVSIKGLQNEFEEIGPVHNDEWEEIKNVYWSAVQQVYDKISAFYNERKEKLNQNTEAKAKLLKEVSAFVQETISKENSIKEWDSSTQKILAFQEQWKTIGYANKTEGEQLWNSFRAQCDHFFSAKKAFFNEIRQEQDKYAEAKQKLIDKANALKDQTDWKNTSLALINLQKEWKKIPHAGQKNENVLWKNFRAACDHFFNAKEAHFKSLESEFEDNLLQKEALIKEIVAFKGSGEKAEALKQLKDFASRFNAIGNVPIKMKDEIYKSFKTALDQHYDDLKLAGEEKEKVMFQAKIDTLKASPEAARLIDKEKRDLRQKIDKLKQDIIQFENNLGFFANSKNAQPLIKEVEQKIERSKQHIESFKKQLKLLASE